MPRERRRRRRRRSASATQPIDDAPSIDSEQFQVTDVERRGRGLTAGMVVAIGLGIWFGWSMTVAGELTENIALWAGVLMAGLGGGRLLRRSLQRLRDRDR